MHPPIVETPEALLAKSKTKRVESATGPKILAPGFFCPKSACKTGQAKRSLVLSTILLELG
jgi:hypothetical protein